MCNIEFNLKKKHKFSEMKKNKTVSNHFENTFLVRCQCSSVYELFFRFFMTEKELIQQRKLLTKH